MKHYFTKPTGTPTCNMLQKLPIIFFTALRTANGWPILFAYYASLDTLDGQAVSPLFQIGNVVDKVGSGDCFMAGLIYGIMMQHSPKSIIGFAAAAAFGKLQEQGDATKNNVAQIEKILSQYE
jgi:2-dehydro-3-deoxygluconokinase